MATNWLWNMFGQQEASRKGSMNNLLCNYFVRFVAIEADQKGANKAFVKLRTEAILDYIKTAEKRFRGDVICVGSSYQGLKVGEANEFDYNIPLNIPPRHSQNVSFVTNTCPGYGFTEHVGKDPITVPSHLQIHAGYAPLGPPPGRGFDHGLISYTRWPDNDDITRCGDIVPFLVRKRLKELIVCAVRDLRDPSLDLQSTVQMHKRVHGPAITVNINRSTWMGKELVASVDFSPLIRLGGQPFPSGCGWPRRDQMWPPREKVAAILAKGINYVAKTAFYWQISYAEVEKDLATNLDNDGGCRKKAHRIMKQLNKHFWCPTTKPAISSYILKNVLFWECESKPGREEWCQDRLWERIESMSQYLLQSLEWGHLSQYFDARINLHSERDTQELATASTKLRKFLENPSTCIQNKLDTLG